MDLGQSCIGTIQGQCDEMLEFVDLDLIFKISLDSECCNWGWMGRCLFSLKAEFCLFGYSSYLEL